MLPVEMVNGAAVTPPLLVTAVEQTELDSLEDTSCGVDDSWAAEDSWDTADDSWPAGRAADTACSEVCHGYANAVV